MSMRPFTLASLAAASLAFGAPPGTAAEEPKMQHERMQMDHMKMMGTLDHQVEMAKSAADHEAVAKRFEDEAAQFEKQASEHERLARRYRGGMGIGPKTNAESLASHCDSLVKNLRASAADAREMAQLHRDVGKQLAK